MPVWPAEPADRVIYDERETVADKDQVFRVIDNASAYLYGNVYLNGDRISGDSFSNPMYYGATGDGVANDTAALTAAIGAGKEAIYIPTGKTFLTDAITVNSGRLTFTGGGTLKLRTATNSGIIYVINGEVSLLNITLDGNNLNMPSDFAGLASAINATAFLNVDRCTVMNTGKGCGIRSDVDGNLFVSRCLIDDIAYTGVMVRGSGKSLITGNAISNTGSNAIMARSNTAGSDPLIRSKGCVISNNIISDVRDDFAGTGQHGNGINLYRLEGVVVSGNSIQRCAWSFIRGNDSNYSSVTGNICKTNNDDAGIFMEFGASYVSINSNTIQDSAESGIALTNVEDGTVGLQCCNNVIVGFGRLAASHGIILSVGLCSNNYIDGLGVNSVAAVRIGTPSTISTYEFRALVEGNQIAGTKYAVAIGLSSTTGTKHTMIVNNQVTRMDGNWVGPIGATGGSNSDAGTGELIVAATAATVYMDGNNWNIPLAQTPLPFADGSRVQINGKLNKSAGGVWTQELARIYKFKTSNQTMNNTVTLTDDTDLQFPIAANEIWIGKIVMFTNGNGTADLQMDLSLPAGAASNISVHGQRALDAIVEAGGTFPLTIGTSTSGSRHVTVEFYVANGANAGQVKLRWAQAVLTVANLVVAAGSYLDVQKVS